MIEDFIIESLFFCVHGAKDLRCGWILILFDDVHVLHTNKFHPLLCFLLFQNADDLLVASAECPSDDEDLEECEPGNGESTQGVLFW